MPARLITSGPVPPIRHGATQRRDRSAPRPVDAGGPSDVSPWFGHVRQRRARHPASGVISTARRSDEPTRRRSCCGGPLGTYADPHQHSQPRARDQGSRVLCASRFSSGATGMAWHSAVQAASPMVSEIIGDMLLIRRLRRDKRVESLGMQATVHDSVLGRLDGVSAVVDNQPVFEACRSVGVRHRDDGLI